jgi:integrase
MGKLTAKGVENAATKDSEYKLGDGDGLFLRVRPNGTKSWLFRFRLANDRKLITMTIGSVSDLSLKDARATLPKLRELVKQNIDPRNARAAAQAENAQAITMQQLFNDWIKLARLTEKFSPAWAARHEDRWRIHLKKPLANILVKDVTRRHLAAALDAIRQKGIKEETRKALSTLNLILDYALKRQSIEQNPARMLKPKDFTATANRPRDRALTLKELRMLWLTLDQATIQPDGTGRMAAVTSTAIKILILTGARRGEVAAMRWSELDLNKGVWSLDSSRTKNRLSHTIYLSQLAIELLQELKTKTERSKFVFKTSRSSIDTHIHKDSLTTAINRLCRNKPLVSIPSFSIHDLRRSAATAWGEHLKTEPHVIERMLNHQPLNKLIATYQRAVYDEEQKAAWHAWGEIVEHQIAKESINIIAFRMA